MVGVWSRKALTALQRRPRGVATGLPSHSNKAAVATPGGPYGRKKEAFSDKNRGQKFGKIFAPKEP